MTFLQLKQNLANDGITLSDAVLEKLKLYAELLKEWNEKINLTSIVEEDEIIEKHFYDCLLLLKGISFEKKCLVDLGSGAGFPGMVLAIVCPELQVTLVDSTAKKFLFLKEIKKRLDVKNVEFHVGRVEDFKEGFNKFDVAVSRGFAAMPIFLEVAAPLTKVGGTIIAMKGSKGEEEFVSSKGAISKLSLQLQKKLSDELPSSKALRINYFFQKTGATPSRYPRRWSEIVKKPL